MVFHSWQLLHLPSHLELVCPQLVQANIFLGLANPLRFLVNNKFFTDKNIPGDRNA